MKRKSLVAFVSTFLLAALAVPVSVTAQTVDAVASASDIAQQAIASVDTPKSGDSKVSPEGKRHYEAGVRLYESAKFAEALTEFKEATKVLPNDAQAHFMQGMSEARLQLYKEAVESFKVAVRVRPEWADAQFRLGIVSYVSGRRMLAIDAYTSLVKLNSPLANILFRAIKDEKNGDVVATYESLGDDFWSYSEKPRVAVEKVSTATEKIPAPKETTPVAQPTVATPSLSDIYRIGVGDVLDIRVLNSVTSRSTLYSVLEGGLIEYPVAGGPMLVGGLTTDEVQTALAAELKRRAVEDDARITVGIRQYSSHTVRITGLVNNPGTRFLRREAVPLYVIMAESQARQDAGRVVVMRSGNEVVLDLGEPASLNYLIKSGDLISVTARPQQFYYIGGKIKYPGQKVFQTGLTLLQAMLAAGGPARQGDNEVELSRESGTGHLVTRKFSLKEIKAGKIPDPRLQPDDRIDVVK